MAKDKLHTDMLQQEAIYMPGSIKMLHSDFSFGGIKLEKGQLLYLLFQKLLQLSFAQTVKLNFY